MTWRAAARPTSGFTLIEVMVVLVIVGISLTMIRLGGGVLDRVAGGDGTSATDAVRRLSLSAARANEMAQVRGRPMRIDLLAGAYRFYAMDSAGRWSPVEDDPLFAERTLPGEWRWVAASRDGVALEAPYRLHFGSEPVRFNMQLAAGAELFTVRGNSSGAVDWHDAAGAALPPAKAETP